MRRQKISLVLFLVLIFIPALSWAWQGKVVGVSDGDTITVLHDGKVEKIRLYGIDCPEHRQDFSQEAKKFTSRTVFGKTVEVKPIDTDRYGRTVGIVSIDEKSLNEELVKAGLAWVYIQYCKESFCNRWEKSQEDAKKAKSGLWSTQNPTPPWKFRQGEKSSENKLPSPSNSKRRSKEANYLHGDTVTHVFHTPSCKDYNCRNCIVPFKTKNQAIRAGYRPCELCNP
jgi:endonuclease YncB( thermonuclease family)